MWYSFNFAANKSPRFEVSKFQGTTEMNSDMTVSTVEPMDKYPASGAFGVGQPHFGNSVRLLFQKKKLSGSYSIG